MSVFVEPPNLISSQIRAFFTTRNLADINDHIQEVLSARFHISKNDIYVPIQKHTGEVHVLESGGDRVVADSVITRRKHILIGIVVADCVPVLLYHRKGVIGAAHAGWRGTAKEILKRTIEKMRERYDCNPRDIQIAIGPSIRRCSYEVGEEVIHEVQRTTGDGDYYSMVNGRYYIDLASANKIQALASGLAADNIWQSGECTFCNPEKYYSYRFAGGSTGRQGGFIGML